ncbi:MAG: tetratricopeptide repeat protein [Ignavibacteria bacterium]|nr:tetratricopeptide repeat protein [Ignavibacteria bacterium]
MKFFKVIILIILTVFYFSCGDKSVEKSDLLMSAKKMLDSAQALNSKELKLEAVELYNEFINKYPDSSKVIDAFYEIARIYTDLNEYKEVIKVYENIAKKYPNTKDERNALFMIAFTYDSSLRDTLNAIAAYKRFLEKYPKDTEGDRLSESADLMLKSLEGKFNLDELLKEKDTKVTGGSEDSTKKGNSKDTTGNNKGDKKDAKDKKKNPPPSN